MTLWDLIKYTFWVGILVLATTGISFFLSTANVLFRDIKFVVPLLLQIWLYVTPVIYSTDQVPEKYNFYLKLNPLMPLIEGVRDVTVFNRGLNFSELAISFLVASLILVSGYWWFKNREKIFADVM